MSEDTDTARPRARAVFSPADFSLMKEALGEFIRNLPAGDPRTPATPAPPAPID